MHANYKASNDPQKQQQQQQAEQKQQHRKEKRRKKNDIIFYESIHESAKWTTVAVAVNVRVRVSVSVDASPRRRHTNIANAQWSAYTNLWLIRRRVDRVEYSNYGKVIYSSSFGISSQILIVNIFLLYLYWSVQFLNEWKHRNTNNRFGKHKH